MIRGNRRAAARILILLVFVVAAFAARPAHAILEEGHEIASLPSVPYLNGGAFSFSHLQDTYTVFIFFSIYSDTSGELLEFAGRLHDDPEFEKPVQVIGVNIDPSREAVEEYLGKYQLPFRIAMDISLELADRFSVKEMPTMFLVDPDGLVLLAEEGITSEDLKSGELMEKVSLRMGVTPAPPEVSDDEAAEADMRFQEKKMISSSARSAKFCPVCKSDLLYIADDGVLWTFDYDTMKREQVATGVGSANWSPDGGSIVFAKDDNSGIWLKPLGGEPKKISPEGRDPVCSSHYNMIAFIVGEDEIWVSRLTVGKRWKVAANGKKVEWSPDGTLLMVTDSKKRVWMVSPYSRATLLKTIFD